MPCNICDRSNVVYAFVEHYSFPVKKDISEKIYNDEQLDEDANISGICKECSSRFGFESHHSDGFCQRCKLVNIYLHDGKQCTYCKKTICFHNFCCVYTGCQTPDGICQECILKHDEKVECSICGQDIKKDLSKGLGTVVDNISMCIQNERELNNTRPIIIPITCRKCIEKSFPNYPFE